jgi:hypothetical protein
MELFSCPGCACQFTMPVATEAPCSDLKCKRCGADIQTVESRSRVCSTCGICGICGSAHTVVLRGPELIITSPPRVSEKT